MLHQKSTTSAEPTPRTRVHVLGAGPVGLLMTALLQSSQRFSVHLYEKRRDYTRTRMVQLASYLVADSVAGYCTDYIDDESIRAVFESAEIDEGLKFRQSIPADVMTLLSGWTQGFCPLNAIEQSLSDLIDARQSHPVQRVAAHITHEDALELLEPGDIMIDCTGSKSVLRNQLVTGDDGGNEDANTFQIRLEYALVITFLYDEAYACNEFCKYYKNVDNEQYKFIPAVNRTYHDGSISHVTGIVTISAEDYERMPPRFDGPWLRANFPHVAQSMDRFIDKIKEETNGEVVGELEIIRIPLDLYRAHNATSREWVRTGPEGHPFARSPVFLAGDSAMGSPYFQSISLGFESAMFLAGLLTQGDRQLLDMLDRYELFAYKQWLRVYMRSKMIKHNKDLLGCIGDAPALLEKLHIY